MRPLRQANVTGRPPGPLLAAAVDYAHNGWPVLRGPACDGKRYTRGFVPEQVPALEPIYPDRPATTDIRKAWNWWRMNEYAILTPAGQALDVITVPAAVAATMADELHCPISVAPDGARLFLSPIRRGDTTPSTCDRFVPLPPSRTLDGWHTWLVTPESLSWQLGDPDQIRAAVAGSGCTITG